MAVTHTGQSPAALTEYMNPNDTDTFWMSWTDKLNGETISTSTWILPAGFTEVSDTSDGTVTEDGTTYDDANSVTLSTTNTKGKHTIFNEIVTSGGRTIRRGIIITIDECL
jgi:hypothetical protein